MTTPPSTLGSTRRTATRLADGRELLYFDDTPGPVRVLTDRRDLPTVVPTPTARFDALLGEWVGIAGHRQTRTFQPPAHLCPLCPTTSEFATEIPSPEYDVVVFENRFPSFGGEGDIPPSGHPLFRQMPGRGRCEVVCYTSDHDADLADLSAARMATVIEAWADRTEALSELPGVEQIFPFTNSGAEIGVTLAHPHGQIYGYPYVTPKTAAMVRRATEYRAETGGNLFEDVVAAEMADGTRLVARNAHWVAFVPFAARWPYEIQLHPLRPVADLAETTPQERAALAPIYLEVLRRLRGVVADTVPFIAGWHQAPVRSGREEMRLHLQVLSIRRDVGKLKYLAGSESSMGAFVNDVTPEDAARRLREVLLEPAV